MPHFLWLLWKATMVVSIFLFSPWSLGRWSNLTNIFQMGWFNKQPVMVCLSTSSYCLAEMETHVANLAQECFVFLHVSPSSQQIQLHSGKFVAFFVAFFSTKKLNPLGVFQPWNPSNLIPQVFRKTWRCAKTERLGVLEVKSWWKLERQQNSWVVLRKMPGICLGCQGNLFVL